jgi:hypothetical protein
MNFFHFFETWSSDQQNLDFWPHSCLMVDINPSSCWANTPLLDVRPKAQPHIRAPHSGEGLQMGRESTKSRYTYGHTKPFLFTCSTLGERISCVVFQPEIIALTRNQRCKTPYHLKTGCDYMYMPLTRARYTQTGQGTVWRSPYFNTTNPSDLQNKPLWIHILWLLHVDLPHNTDITQKESLLHNP